MYSSNLTDAEWAVIEKLLDSQRKRKWDLRTQILDGLFYVLKSGCQWRMLPKDFAPWKTVYDYFFRWKNKGIWSHVHEALRRMVRQKEGKYISPSLGIVDSQSVPTGPFIEKTKGFDGNKKIKGRKRHVIVDTMGLIMAIVITAANVSDKEGFIQLAKGLRSKFWRLVKILADGTYQGDWSKRFKHWVLEVGSREKGQKGFKVQPKRWVVERTFGWFEHYRRLSKDYEFNPKTSKTMIQLVMIRIMLARVA